eukprot:g1674.t1
MRSDTCLSLPEFGIHLRFDATSQRLRVIDLYDVAKPDELSLAPLAGGNGGERRVFASTAGVRPTFQHIYELFGPTFAGSYDEQYDAYILTYNGVSVLFPIPERYRSRYDGGGTELPLELPDGTTPAASRIILFHGKSVEHAQLPPLPPDAPYFEPVFARVGVRGGSDTRVLFANRGTSLKLGCSLQAVLGALGEPSARFDKPSGGTAANVFMERDFAESRGIPQTVTAPSAEDVADDDCDSANGREEAEDDAGAESMQMTKSSKKKKKKKKKKKGKCKDKINEIDAEMPPTEYSIAAEVSASESTAETDDTIERNCRDGTTNVITFTTSWKRVEQLFGSAGRPVEKSIAEANARKQTQQEVELAKAEAKDVADLKPKLHQKAIAPVKACAATEAMATARTEVDSKCAYTSDDAKHDAGIVNEADEQFVVAVESAAAAVEAAAVAAAGAREDCQYRKHKLDVITQSCDDGIRERADGCNIDDPVAKIRRLASLPIDELVARHEEEMAQMVDSVTKSAAAGAASAEITNASANSDISAVDTTGMIVEEYERDSGADAVVAPEPITPQGVHLSPANGGQDARDSALANVSANADMQCSKSEIEHAAPKIGAEGRKVWSDRANEEHDQEQVDHRWRGREGKPNTTAARHAKSRRRRENLKAQSNQYLYKQQVAHLDAVRQRMAEERARGYTERLEQWQRLEQHKRWLDEVEETNREFNPTKNVM